MLPVWILVCLFLPSIILASLVNPYTCLDPNQEISVIYVGPHKFYHMYESIFFLIV